MPTSPLTRASLPGAPETDRLREGPVREGLSRPVAALIVAGVLGTSAVLGRRNAPDPSHPKTRRWYKRLDKPDFTPPTACSARSGRCSKPGWQSVAID
ncbi:hypothetical protein QP162_15075 [Sphingomonas aurantiaca]|uniref:hypothetical protein n=1 Tax=Sphingomonas aurantiaca TaxID=185949 RepID=UPI002FE10156